MKVKISNSAFAEDHTEEIMLSLLKRHGNAYGNALPCLKKLRVDADVEVATLIGKIAKSLKTKMNQKLASASETFRAP